MSNAINIASAAADIVAPLLEADEELKHKKETTQHSAQVIDQATVGAYARAAVVISGLIEQGAWTTGKQKGGIISASAALKDAVAAEAAAKGLSKAKAKRVVEKAAALVEPKSKARIDAVAAAAKEGHVAVVKALAEREITKEKHILVHVETPEPPDPVLRLIKAIGKVDGADYKRLVKEIVNHAIIDDILVEANKTTPAEREAARKAEAATKSNAAAKAAEARKAKAEKKAEPQAKPVPKQKDKKKKAEPAPAEPDFT